MSRFTNYSLRLSLLNAKVEVFLAAILSDVLIPRGMPDRQITLREFHDSDSAVVVLEMPMTLDQSKVVGEKLANIPDHLIAFGLSGQNAIISVALRKMTEEESNQILQVLKDEWGLTVPTSIKGDSGEINNLATIL